MAPGRNRSFSHSSPALEKADDRTLEERWVSGDITAAEYTVVVEAERSESGAGERKSRQTQIRALTKQAKLPTSQ